MARVAPFREQQLITSVTNQPQPRAVVFCPPIESSRVEQYSRLPGRSKRSNSRLELTATTDGQPWASISLSASHRPRRGWLRPGSRRRLRLQRRAGSCRRTCAPRPPTTRRRWVRCRGPGPRAGRRAGPPHRRFDAPRLAGRRGGSAYARPRTTDGNERHEELLVPNGGTRTRVSVSMTLCGRLARATAPRKRTMPGAA